MKSVHERAIEMGPLFGLGQLLALTASYVHAVEGLLWSEITWAGPSVAVAFVIWSQLTGSASGESDSLLQKFSLKKLKEFNQSWPFVGLWFCWLSVLSVFSLGWFWAYLVLAAMSLAICIAA